MVISTLEIKVRKKCQSFSICESTSLLPDSRAAFNPEPTPNHPGTICRDWVQPNTHGIARSEARPPLASGRRDGREPRNRFPSCSTGVEA